MDYKIDEYSINPPENRNYVNHRENGYTDPFQTIWLDNDNSWPHMPGDLLAAKFEETVLYNEDENYDEFMRQAVTDKGPDPNLMGDEAGHRTEYSNYRLNTQYHGTTGKQELPYNPEAFTGIIGDNDDKRMWWQEINWEEMNRQNSFRMNRYQNFRGTNDNEIIGSGVNPWKAQEMNKLASCRWGKQLAIFSRERDNHLYGLKYFTKPQPVKCCIQKRDNSAPEEMGHESVSGAPKKTQAINLYKSTTKDFASVVNFASGSRGAGTKKSNMTTQKNVKGGGIEAFESINASTRKLGVLMSAAVNKYSHEDAEFKGSQMHISRKNNDIIHTLTEIKILKSNIDAQNSIEAETRDRGTIEVKDITRHTGKMHDDQIEFAQIIAKMVYPERDIGRITRRQNTNIKMNKARDQLQYKRLKRGNRRDNTNLDAEEMTDASNANVHNYKAAHGNNKMDAFKACRGDGEYGSHSCILKGAVNRYINAAQYSKAEIGDRGNIGAESAHGDVHGKEDYVDDLKIAPLGKKMKVRRYVENELHQNDFAN